MEVCIYTNPKTGYVLESCIYYSLMGSLENM